MSIHPETSPAPRPPSPPRVSPPHVSPPQVSLSRADYRTLGLAALGGSLEIYDFIVFAFFAATLGKVFFPPQTPDWLRLIQTFGIFAAGYLARPLGGIVMAHHADRGGRKKMFGLSILMMALPCLAIGVMPTYRDIGFVAPLLLLALRIVQGAAVGGEVPGAWVFVAEHAPPARRGTVLGILQAGLTFGYLLGALTAAWLARVFSPAEMLDYAWRVPFLLGGVFGMLGVWLRRWLSETPVFTALRARRQDALRYPVLAVLREHRAALLPAVILTCVLTSAVVTLVVVTPTLLQQRFGMPASRAFGLSSIAIVCLNIGCVLGGRIGDRIGAWRAVALYSLLMPLGIGVLYASLIHHWPWPGAAYALAGLSCGIVGVVPAAMVGLFPPALRVSGISLTYNIAYAIWASTTPLLLIALAPWSAWSSVVYCAVMGALGCLTACIAPALRLSVRGVEDAAVSPAARPNGSA